jgi:hypothetical protein
MNRRPPETNSHTDKRRATATTTTRPADRVADAVAKPPGPRGRPDTGRADTRRAEIESGEIEGVTTGRHAVARSRRGARTSRAAYAAVAAVVGQAVMGAVVVVLVALHQIGSRVQDRTRLAAGEVADEGSETADKILWTAAIVVIVGAVGLVMKNMLVAAVNSIKITLGW